MADVKFSQYAKNAGIGYRAAWNRYKAGRIEGAWQDEHGTIHVPDPASALAPKAAVYARVSSHTQKEDLERQAQRMIDYALARGLQVVSVTKEVASGADDSRPKLSKLLASEDWGTLVVEHRDRLTRVGFNWFDVLLSRQGRRIDVANLAQEQTSDLMDDFLSIIYSFTARLYGLRGSRNRSRKLIAALEDEAAGI
ncbi:Predicted site-specific integrase-resolvase [Arthrobacter crystallopoietes]|uniref:Predicted site-specific integrase-resolvase n=1 Tax=Crystallibacter crystallopoietes TaxID=37928 RepID=A0A1H0ZVM2_9MICC|nr:Predicted site-specific integrase-resolvase [Arthrobacter crystallopoietes]